MYSNAENVTQLYTGNFEQFVLTDNSCVWFVVFYASWCEHCRNVSIEFKKAAKQMKGIVKCGAVEGEQNKVLVRKYQIDGYPMFKLFGVDKSRPIDYVGPLKSNDFIRFSLLEAKRIVR